MNLIRWILSFCLTFSSPFGMIWASDDITITPGTFHRSPSVVPPNGRVVPFDYNYNGQIIKVRYLGTQKLPNGQDVRVFEPLEAYNNTPGSVVGSANANSGATSGTGQSTGLSGSSGSSPSNSSGHGVSQQNGSSPGKGGNGWGDAGEAAGASAIIYAAVEGYDALYGANMGVAEQLRNAYHGNLDANRKYADDLSKLAEEVGDYGRDVSVSTGTRAGARLGNVDTDNPNYQQGSKDNFKGGQEPECIVQVDEGGINDLPKDLQNAYYFKNYARLAQYAELLFKSGGASDFCRQQITKITNGDKVLHIPSINEAIEPSPLDNHKFKTSSNNLDGEVVRKVANKYQVEWAHTKALKNLPPEKVYTYTTGLNLLKSADRAFSVGKVTKGTGLVQASELMLNITTGLVDGVTEAATQLAKSFPEMGLIIKDLAKKTWADPAYVIEVTEKLYNQMPEVYEGIKQELIKNYDILQNGNAYERSKLIGKIGFDLATSYATGAGSIKIVQKGINVLDRVNEAKRASKLLKRMKTQLGEVDYHEAIRGRTMAKTIDLDEDLVTQQARRLKQSVEQAYLNGADLSDNAKDFLAGQIVSETKLLGAGQKFSQSQLASMGQRYHQFEQVTDVLEFSAFDKVEVVRGVPKSYQLPDGVVVYPGPDNVFEFHPGTYYASGRYTMPGETGLYGTMSESMDLAKETIRLEIGSPNIDNILFGKAHIQSTKILDLTESTVGKSNLHKLGISSSDLVMDANYVNTQALGHLARKNSFEAILFESAKKPGVQNIVIF